MQNKSELLVSQRAVASYNRLRTYGTPATMCRGLSSSEEDFFYATADNKYWSEYCRGWIIDVGGGNDRVCPSCAMLKAQPNSTRSLIVPQAEYIASSVSEDTSVNKSKPRTVKKPKKKAKTVKRKPTKTK